ncbi:Subtilisin-like protease [Morella rubra]|uniref:Subtilisin-like protease n=1 Tax=Morella rubra TaxID=262757 RepID=A0A6A1W9Y6_9ROSI|nr:Subtilisin-like protease [Morella rubra]
MASTKPAKHHRVLGSTVLTEPSKTPSCTRQLVCSRTEPAGVGGFDPPVLTLPKGVGASLTKAHWPVNFKLLSGKKQRSDQEAQEFNCKSAQTILMSINVAMSAFSHLFLFAWFLLAIQPKAMLADRAVYIVHMDAYSMPKAFVNNHCWFSSIIASLKSTNLPSSDNYTSSPSLLYVYNQVFKGFSAFLSKYEVEALKKSPGYISAVGNITVFPQTTYTPEFLSLNPTTGLWPASSYGTDVIVGVLDSGIWPESESFKDTDMTLKVPEKWKGTCQIGQDFNSSMCNAKLIGARYFNKGLLKHTPVKKVSMNSARDTLGHGTITSSIAVGNYVNDASYFGYAPGVAKGVAPKARLAIYKVVWEEGAVSPDSIAGIEQAISDQVDVISLSMVQESVPIERDPFARSTFSAMEKGIFVSAAAGNIAPGRTTVSNGYPWALTVTASTTDRWFNGILDIDGVIKIVGWSLYRGSVPMGSLPLVYNKTLSTCGKILLEAPPGIIICRGGSLSVLEQLNHLSHAGVEGGIIVVKFSTLEEMDVIEQMDCACILIDPSDAEVLFRHMEATPSMSSASLIFQQTNLGVKGMPTFASYGLPGPSHSIPCILKPDVMAPGSLILSAWPSNVPLSDQGVNKLYNNFNIVSGTSVACPHASGVAALLKGAHPEWSSAAVKSAIITTAIPLDNTFKPIRDNKNYQAASPLSMGAGQIDPNQALDPGLIYDAAPQDYVNLLCSMNFNQRQIFDITGSRKYSCSKPSSDLNYPSFMVLYRTKGEKFERSFRRTVTNVGQDRANYTVTVTGPKDSNITVSPQILSFTEKNQKRSYTVTIKYAGKRKVEVAYGDLAWEEENGHYKVRSPIVIAFDRERMSRGSC